MSTKPLNRRTVDYLLRRAAEYETMAASATMLATAEALLRLGARYREMARQRVGTLIHQGGEPASQGGVYQQLNIFGTPTDTTIRVEQGEPLPAAPRGFTWRLTEER